MKRYQKASNSDERNEIRLYSEIVGQVCNNLSMKKAAGRIKKIQEAKIKVVDLDKNMLEEKMMEIDNQKGKKQKGKPKGKPKRDVPLWVFNYKYTSGLPVVTKALAM